MQNYNDEERRWMKGFQFTSAELKIVHDFTLGCWTFARILLPLQSFINFLGHHHHWMEWFGLTIEINGFWWFWGLTTIDNDGFQWLPTIGPTMERLPTIVEV